MELREGAPPQDDREQERGRLAVVARAVLFAALFAVLFVGLPLAAGLTYRNLRAPNGNGGTAQLAPMLFVA